jgi:hypothetical protein
MWLTSTQKCSPSIENIEYYILVNNMGYDQFFAPMMEI